MYKAFAVFFNKQKTSVFFDYSGDCDMGCPNGHRKHHDFKKRILQNLRVFGYGSADGELLN